MQTGRGRSAPLAVLVAALLAAAAPLWSDGTQTGTVVGKVVDSEGTPLPGAEVRLDGPQTRRRVVTDERGSFRFASLSVGSYRVEAELLGLTALEPSVQVFIGNTTDLTLELGAETSPQEPLAESEWIQVVAQAPVTDKYDPRVGAEISLDFLHRLPVERFYQSVALVLPGVSGGEDGNPQTSGSLRSHNLFLVDGVDTTDATTGLFGLNLNYEAIQAVDVTTAGPTSEYGRVSGAVINVVTRSGGGGFEGTLRLIGTNNGWDDPYDYPQQQVAHLEPDLLAANSGPDRIDQTVAIAVGGPVKEDRLWFFAAYEDSEDTFLATTRQRQFWNQGVALQNATLKLTLRPAAQHTLVLQAASDAAEFQAFTPFERGPAENRATSIPTPLSFSIVGRLPGDLFALQRQTQDGEFAKLQWNAVVSQNLSFGLTAAEQQRQLERGRLNSRGVTADAPHIGVTRFRDVPGADPILEEVVLYNGITDRGYEERPRTQANLAVDWFTAAGRSEHELTFGIDYQETESERFFNFPGERGIDRATGREVQGQMFIDFDRRASCLVSRICVPFDTATGEFQPLVLWNFWARDARLSREEHAALYASDTLSIGDWVVVVGARFESVEGVGESQATGDRELALVEDEVVAPRLNVTYDSRGDGTVLFSVGFGRYYEPFLQQYVDSFGRRDILSGFTEYGWAIGSSDCRPTDSAVVDSPCWIPRQLHPFLRLQAGAPNLALKRSYVDELVVGFERQLTPQTGFSLHYIDRRWTDLWDNVLQIDFPEGDVPRQRSEILNLDIAERKYRGIQLLFQKRYADNWQLLGSYTWSETEGNLFQNDGLSDFSDYSEVTDLNLVNRYGLAPYDRENRFRLYVNYEIPWRVPTLSFGTVVRYESGVPYQAEAATEFGTRFLQPRGAERLDEIFQWDLSASLRFRLGAGTELELKGEVFNLTNETGQLGAETVLDTGIFGLPRTILDLQRPRSYRLSLALGF